MILIHHTPTPKQQKNRLEHASIGQRLLLLFRPLGPSEPVRRGEHVDHHGRTERHAVCCADFPAITILRNLDFAGSTAVALLNC